MAEYAPSRYWVVVKDETPVAKFDTPGETVVASGISSHDAFSIKAVDGREELSAVQIDRSVLSDEEERKLGYR